MASGAVRSRYNLYYDARYGGHYHSENEDPATHRHAVELEQKFQFNKKWSGAFGGRGEYEEVYDPADQLSLIVRDNYVQFQNGGLRLRAGYQQVVWGEAFGFYYADIVNPKDYREAGLGDLSRNRLAIPMLNFQWIWSDASLQVLLIPIPMFSLLPPDGSDFNLFALPTAFSGFTVDYESTPEDPPKAPELGARVTKQFGGYDFSVFYFNYHDRSPVVQALFFPPVISLKPEYKPLQTLGTTMTVDLEGYLLRSEVLTHLAREINTLDNGTLSSEKSNELVYVVGVDLPPMEHPQLKGWQASFQFSESRLEENTWLLRRSTQSLLSARIAREFSNQSDFEVLLSHFTSDGSNLLQSSFTYPLSSRFELVAGLDKFSGGPSAEFGRYRDASRYWIMFRASFKK